MLPFTLNWIGIKKLPLFRKLKVIGKALLVALLTWALILVITYSSRPADIWLEWNDLFFYTRFFKNPIGHEKNARHQEHALDNLLVIDSVDPTENLSRGEYAAFIELLTAANVACIGMDLRFVEDRSWDGAGQAALARAFQNNARIVLPFRIPREKQKESDEDYALAKNSIERRFSLSPHAADSAGPCQMFRQKTSNLDGFYLEHPIRPLLENADYLGHINFDPERYHLFPLVLGFDNFCYKSFAFEVARAYRDSRGEGLALAAIPTRKHGRMLVNYLPRDHFALKTMTDARALLEQSPENFRGKIVLIVNSHAERPIVRTSLDRGEYPLWAIHASLICQILDADNIHAAKFANVALAMLLIILGLLWLLFFSERFSLRWRRMRWVLLACNAALALCAFLFLQADYWLGLVVPVLICSVGLTAVRYDFAKIYALPKYQIFALSVTEAQEEEYPVSITFSPAGEEQGNVTFSGFFKKPDFRHAVERLRQNAGTLKELRELGNQLYAALFQPSIQDRLQVSLALAERNQARLRIQLRLDDPEISALPWEYMRSDKLPVEFMALNPALSLTRYIPFAAPLTLKEFRGPLKILVAIAGPMDLPPLNVNAEKTGIAKALGAALANLGFLRQVKVDFLQPATRVSLDHAIANGNYDVLHFIGHSEFVPEKKDESSTSQSEEGKNSVTESEVFDSPILEKDESKNALTNTTASEDEENKRTITKPEAGDSSALKGDESNETLIKGTGYLALEDDDGKKVLVGAEDIGFMIFGSSIRLAVLNSCESAVASSQHAFYGLAQKIVHVGVPAVVAMQHKIFDDTAIAFTWEFYHSLLANYSIDAAVYDARQALAKKLGLARQDWGTPVLFMRTGGAEVFESGMNTLK